MLSRANIMRLAFSSIAVILLIFSVTLSLFSATEVGGKKAIIFDKKIIGALDVISANVPENESMISPNFTPIVMYFSQRPVFTPYSVENYTSLLNLMDAKNYSYLLVFENKSDVTGLTQVFQKENLSNLTKDFKEISAHNTDFSKLHLYRRP
jgi:hypothetical protein